jgi:sugar phosphate isomerase/epimerase
MKRRTFSKNTIKAAAFIGVTPSISQLSVSKPYIRLGGPLFEKVDSPDSWIAELKRQNYRAAYCPLKPGVSSEEIKAYKSAAIRGDILISEVGVWINLISPDEKVRKEAIAKTTDGLYLGESIGANCCVNVSGSKNPAHWAGPHKDNLTEDTFDEIVETTRKIIDEVKPKRTFFALEPMPWAYPDSADNYLRLVKAIDRAQFGVHLDPMNLIVSPQLFFNSGSLIKECFKKLGPYIRSCHGKDIVLREDIYTPQLTECRPGLGFMDYATFLRELAKLRDIPLMMEHLDTEAEYNLAAGYIRSVGKKEGIAI